MDAIWHLFKVCATSLYLLLIAAALVVLAMLLPPWALALLLWHALLRCITALLR